MLGKLCRVYSSLFYTRLGSKVAQVYKRASLLSSEQALLLFFFPLTAEQIVPAGTWSHGFQCCIWTSMLFVCAQL